MDERSTSEKPLDLGAVDARAKAATPGPWYSSNSFGRLEIVAHGQSEHDAVAGHYGIAEQDAEFIASSREDVPALLAEVRRLREALAPLCAAARAAVNGIDPMHASVDDLLCDLKRHAAAAERCLVGLPDEPGAAR